MQLVWGEPLGLQQRRGTTVVDIVRANFHSARHEMYYVIQWDSGDESGELASNVDDALLEIWDEWMDASED